MNYDEYNIYICNRVLKQGQEPDKQVWLITYGSGCQSLNHEMLSSNGLVIDQCYTVTWRESKYTLIHLPKQNRTRSTAIIKIMHKLNVAYGIITVSILGFDCIASNTKENKDDSLENHPGFKRIIEVLNTDIEMLDWWMEVGDISSNRKGLLWKFIESTEVSLMTKAQLQRKVKEWSPLIKEYKDLKDANTILTTELRSMEEKLTTTERMLCDERNAADDLLKKLLSKIKKCDELEREIDILRRTQ